MMTVAGAKALEARLYAPCCYGGTLDNHESELARSLRTEIETRLSQGETSETIQSDFVVRYGDKVLAARSDAPIRVMGLALVLVGGAAVIALGFLLRRWTRRLATAPALAAPRDELDDRIDAELADVD